MSQISLFETENNQSQPLAARMRPRNLDEYVGQEHLVGKGKVLRNMIERDSVSSMIFWGPPGVGKTTLAQIIAAGTNAQFINFSAVTSGIKEIKTVMQQADRMTALGARTIVFVDEIHRFNKAQQDAFLPFVEKGSIILIGATTENPSFEVNGALLSRCKVFVLHQLEQGDIAKLIRNAIDDPRGFGDMEVRISDDEVNALAAFANGDARTALSTLEMMVLNADHSVDEKTGREIVTVTPDDFEQCTSRKSLLYDKQGEEHYNIISALHKSMRNSDADAAVYWLARMLESGEDPMYIARRVTRFAAEDVGLADPRALELSVAAFQACHLIGMPECSVHLTEAVIYNALAPKSNAMEVAYMQAAADANKTIAEPVPLHIRNAPTKLMKELDYGKGYIYAHDTEDKIADMECLPENLRGTEYYHPGNQGFEPRFKERYEAIRKWREEHKKK
ncbi:MAG: replication-associated recombination protein A [Mogibacterium sp.]|nr:replication-associated recombination protein A [Mogibacterium sp.]MBR2540137.1 replication-associated recombination protein A [Mogibacterium sp.]